MVRVLLVKQSGFKPFSGSLCCVPGQDSLLSRKDFWSLQPWKLGYRLISSGGPDRIYHLFIEIF